MRAPPRPGGRADGGSDTFEFTTSRSSRLRLASSMSSRGAVNARVFSSAPAAESSIRLSGTLPTMVGSGSDSRASSPRKLMASMGVPRGGVMSTGSACSEGSPRHGVTGAFGAWSARSASMSANDSSGRLSGLARFATQGMAGPLRSTSMSTGGAPSIRSAAASTSTDASSARVWGNGMGMRPEPLDRLPGRGGRGGLGVRADVESSLLSSGAPSVSSRVESVAIVLEFSGRWRAGAHAPSHINGRCAAALQN
jgi:hypothetical protein